MTGLRLFAIALIACFALPCAAAAAQTGAEQSKTLPDVPAQYALTAFGDSASVAGRIFPLKIYIQELTSDGDIEELASTLRHKGQDGLAGALDRTSCKGRIEGTGSVGNQVRFVRIRAVNDGGQHIVLAAARPGWRLLHNGAPDIYKISVLDLYVDKDGKGFGSFAPLCTVKFNEKNELEVVQYGWQRYRLANVYRER